MNDIIKNKFLNDVKDVYIKRGGFGLIPNSSKHSLNKDELFLLGLIDRKKVDLKTIADRLKYPKLDSEEFYNIFIKKFGNLKTNKEIQTEKNKYNEQKAKNILNSLNNDYADFITSYYKSDSEIVRNSEKILTMKNIFNKPEKPILLSTLGLDLLNDTHGFDKGTYRTFLDKMIFYIYGDYDLSNHNILVNFSSNMTFTNNIIGNVNNKWITLNLMNLENIKLIKNSEIFIFENIGVFEEYGRNNPNVPIICTAGFINLSSKILINKLIENNNKLFYSGDLDLTGIKIADDLLKECPKVNLWNMNSNTYKKYIRFAIKSPKEQAVNDIQNPILKELQNIIINTGKIINQERIRY